MNDITILHLSDLHIDNTSKTYSKLLKNLIFDIKTELGFIKDKSLVVVVTGDILHKAPQFSKDSTAFTNAEKFFSDLYAVLKDKVSKIYLVPGNHDKFRAEHNKFLIPAYRVLSDQILLSETSAPEFDENFYKNFWQFHLDTYAQESGSGFLELSKKIYKIFGMSDDEIESKSYTKETFGVDVIDINNKKYCFILLNTAWSCIDENDTRNIVLGQFQIDKLRNQHQELITPACDSESPYLTIVLGHHPLNSLKGPEEDKIFSEMISFDGFDANVYLSGHTHDRTVTNWVNNRHSLNTFVTGIGWPENPGGIHVSNNHTYSFYTFNLNANSVDVFVRSTNDGGSFSPDFNIYTNNHDANRKKLVFPIRAEYAQTYIPLSVGDNDSPKAYYISNNFIRYIKDYFKNVEKFRAIFGIALEQEKIDFYDNIYVNNEEYEQNENDDEALYQYLFASTIDQSHEIPKSVENTLKKNSKMLFSMFLGFLQKICEKMQQVFIEDICDENDIVRFHFRYLSDKNTFQYLRLCISFPKESDFENNDVTEIKYGQLIEKAYTSHNSLIYSINKNFVKNDLNEKWTNFITIVPLFPKNTYTRKYTAKSKNFPFITFGVTTNNDKYDELLYCMDYFSFNDTIGDIVEQYLEMFNINLAEFCDWLKVELERGEDNE